MKLIVGLSNPGKQYEKTRHNLGAVVVEQFFKDFEPVGKTVWEDSAKLKSDIVDILWTKKSGGEEKVFLAKPKTYMNNSGMAIFLISAFYKIPAEDIWVIHDDIDLPMGSLRIRFGGGTAGHKGLDSILKSLQTDKFVRFRLGIGHPKNFQTKTIKNVDEYVLDPFAHSERGKVKDLIHNSAKAIAYALEKSLDEAMNRFNTK